MRVALVVMPFASADCPSLAAGLLKSELTRRGIACDVKHFNVTMSAMLGHDAYRSVATMFTSTVLAGEWAFSRVFHGDRVSDWATYKREVLDHPRWGLAAESHELVRETSLLAPAFLRAVFESNDWSRYDLVGFTSTFEQTMPAMCLARMIREAHPEVLLAAGGANFESTLGAAQLEQFEFLDYVCTGEGDRAFPELCEALAAGRHDVPDGILSRRSAATAAHSTRFADMDALAIPDYDDYFNAVARTSSDGIRPWIPLEASRGCWWGQKAHCTFCGLNGESMAFRRKSWRRVADETAALERRYGVRWMQFTDNILSMDYFADLIPHWASSPPRSPMFFEVKSGLRREQIAMLRQAGVVSVQAGVESFSTTTLRLMRKGVSGPQNLAVLRWCRELGLEAHWNLLFGFPGEDLDDYARQLDVVRLVPHLDAPEACSMIRMDRFSPNYSNWNELGFTAVRPVPAYRHVFPVSDAGIERIAYFFEYDHPRLAAVEALGRPLAAACAEWRAAARAGRAGELVVRPHIDGGFVLVDSRFNRAPVSLRLGAADEAALLACDAPVAEAEAAERAKRLRPDSDERDVRQSIDLLLGMESIARIEGRLLTLALLPETFRERTHSRRIDGEPREVHAHG